MIYQDLEVSVQRGTIKQNMDQRSLESFVSAAYHLNFSNAAIDCHITQATLSRQIAALEDEIGTELFVRHKNGVTLTPAGQYLFSCAQSLLEQLKDVVSNCRRAAYDLMPKLRIGLGPYEHILLKKPLAQLLSQTPYIEVGCMSYTYKILNTRYRNNSIDVGLCTSRCASAINGLKIIPLYQEPWQIVAHVNSKLWSLPRSQQSVLQGQTIITTYSNEFEEIRPYCEKYRLKNSNFSETNFLQSQLSLLEAGIGVSLLPPFVREVLPDCLRMEDILPVPFAPLIVLAYDPKNPNPAVSAFRQICSDIYPWDS